MEKSETKWIDFLQNWKVYKRSSGVTGQFMLDDLCQCLSDSLRIEVSNEHGADVKNITEKELLIAKKKMALLIASFGLLIASLIIMW